MGRNCFIPDCSSKTGSVKFYSLPRNEATLDWWKTTSWSCELKFPMRIRVCERHFADEFIDRKYKVPRLVRGALPSLHIEPVPVSDVKWWDVECHESLEMKLTTYCRVCGQQQITKLDSNMQLLEELELLLSVRLELAQSELPKGVCDACTTFVQQVRNFRNQCIEGQFILQDIFVKMYEPEADAEGTILSEVVVDPRETDEAGIKMEGIELEIDEDTEALMNPDESTEPELLDQLGAIVSRHLETVEPPSAAAERSPKAASTRNRRQSSSVKRSPRNVETSTICPVCGKMLMSKPNYTTHLKMHSGQRDHVCNICGKEFYIRRELQMHIESRHERKKFVCTVCGVKCQWRKGLQRHMKKHQENAYKHKCPECDKAFMAPNQLRLHMMKHTGDRLACDICGVGYRFNYMLTQHKIREHNMIFKGVKLYKSTRPSRKGQRSTGRLKNELDEDGEHQQYQLIDVINNEDSE